MESEKIKSFDTSNDYIEFSGRLMTGADVVRDSVSAMKTSNSSRGVGRGVEAWFAGG